MYNNITTAAKNALKANTVTTTARITLTSNNQVIDGEYLQNITITDQCYENGVIVGTAMCKEVEIELINNNFDLADKEFLLEVGVLLPNSTYEYIPYGNFIVKEYQKIISSNHYKLIAYDYMDKFNATFVDNNPTQDDGVTYTNAMTLQSFYEYVANQYGVTIETQNNLPNKNFSITTKPYFDGMSGRVVLSRIAEMMGCFAKINRNNKLEMKLKTTTSEQFSRAVMNNSLEMDNKFGPINVVVLRLSQVEGENVTKRDEASIAQYGETTLQIQDNPFVYTEALRLAAINAIYNQVDGFSYYPTTFNGKLIYLDCGDEVEVQDMATNSYYKTVILKQVLYIPGTRNSQFENKALTSTGVLYQYTPEQVRRDRHTEFLVDKQNSQIQLLVKETIPEIEEQIEVITDTTGTGTGKFIHLDDSSDQPFNSIVMNGETSQVTRSGKNKLPYNYRDGMSKTISGITFTVNEDRSIKANGTATANASFNLTNGSTYTLAPGTYKLVGENSAYANTAIRASFTRNGSTAYVSSSSSPFTVLEGDTNFVFYVVILNGTTVNNVTFYPMLLESTETDLTYEAGGVMPSPDYPSEIKNADGRNKFSGWVKGVGLNSTTGVETSNSSAASSGYIPVNFNSSPNYYLSGATDTLHHWVGAYNAQKQFLGRTGGANSKIRALNANSFTSGTPQGTGDIAYLRVTQYVGSGDTATIDDVDNLQTQLEEGQGATSFVPYDSLKIKVNNINILDIRTENLFSVGTGLDGIYSIGNGVITLNGTPSVSSNMYFNPFKVNEGTYTLSTNITNYTSLESGNSTLILQRSTNNINWSTYVEIASQSPTQIRTFNMSDEYYYRIRFYATTSNTFNNTTYSLQLEKAEESSEFIANVHQTVYFPLQGEHLMQGDYIDSQGIHHVRKHIVFDGSSDENWNMTAGGTTSPTNKYFINASTNNIAKDNSVVICNRFERKRIWATDNIGIQYEGDATTKSFRIRAAQTSISDWRTWLAANPVTVEYLLVEEELTPFTTDQQKAWDEISLLTTYKRITNILSDASLDIEYLKDNGLDVYETRSSAKITKQQVSQLTIDQEGISTRVSAIEDTTTTEQSLTASVNFEDINQSEPVEIRIHPTTTSISYIYPRDNLYPSDTLYMTNRILRFTNTSTNEIFDYELPDALLIETNSGVYDEFYLNYDQQICQVVKRCKYNADGTISALTSAVIHNYSYPGINLTDGNYTIELSGYSNAYMRIVLMKQNKYTSQFATKVEVNSEITQTANEINEAVRQKVGDNEIIAKINAAIKDGQGIIKIQGNQVIIESDYFNLSADGHIQATSGEIGGFNLGETKFNANIIEQDTYTQSDVDRIQDILMGEITPTNSDYDKYDFDRSGKINSSDFLIAEKFVLGVRTGNGEFILDTLDSKNAIQIIDKDTNKIVVNLGVYGSFLNKLTIGNLFFTANMFGYNSNGDTTIVLNNETGEIRCVSLTQTSKEESKKNFELLENGLDIIKNTDIYKYNLKTQEDEDKKHIGFVIGENYNYAHEITAENNGEEVGVDTYSMISVAYKAIQEQQEQIEQLQKEIKQLQEEIENLKGEEDDKD